MSQVIHTLITIPLDPDELTALEAISERLLITHHPVQPGEAIPDEVWAPTEVLFTFRAIPLPEQAPELRWMHTYFAGVDNLLNTPIMGKEKLLISSNSGANAQQTAEYALTMLLALGHALPTFFTFQQNNQWMPNKQEAYIPSELYGSTVGIVGYGSVGRQLARLLHPMQVTVLASKRDAMHPEDDGYTPEGQGDPQGEFFTRLYPPQALRSMFRECDFVVITTPLTEETRGLVGAEQLAALPPHACLVDVSRGGVLDHDALVDALENGTLAFAALDVFPDEPLPTDSPLWNAPNLILTPHVAGFSKEYRKRALALFAENLRHYLDKEPLFNVIKPARGY